GRAGSRVRHPASIRRRRRRAAGRARRPRAEAPHLCARGDEADRAPQPALRHRPRRAGSGARSLRGRAGLQRSLLRRKRLDGGLAERERAARRRAGAAPGGRRGAAHARRPAAGREGGRRRWRNTREGSRIPRRLSVRLVAVQLTDRELRVAWGERGLRGARLTAVERVALDDGTDSLRHALPGLAAARPGTVLTALPLALGTHRFLALPFRDRTRLVRTAPLELLGQLPVGPEGLAVATRVTGHAAGGTEVLAVAVP